MRRATRNSRDLENAKSERNQGGRRWYRVEEREIKRRGNKDEDGVRSAGHDEGENRMERVNGEVCKMGEGGNRQRGGERDRYQE